MNLGLNPHWGSLINDWRVGDWTNFAVNQGFECLEFTVDFRMQKKGLNLIFDKKVINAIKNARRRGLKFHVATEPYNSALCHYRSRGREEGIKQLTQILKFLDNILQPRFTLLYPGSGRREVKSTLDWLMESYQRLLEGFPRLRLGLLVGEEGNCLKTPEEIWRMISRFRTIDLALDIGWAFLTFGDDPAALGSLFQAMKDNLSEIHWHNFLYQPLRRRLPLGRGYLRESHYLKILSFLPPKRVIWHILDYRDRTRKDYLLDKLTLEELSFRASRLPR